MAQTAFLSALDMAAALRAREVSAVELLELALERFRQVNPAVNAVIKTDVARARARAGELDAMAAAGDWAGPLHGVPMTVKDTFDMSFMPAVAGAAQYQHRPAPVPDAAAIVRLKSAGAVIWGKTNTPYLAGNNQTFNDIFGVTNNPYDLSRTPGGSSGGSAAALASGMTTLELGSDIGGSIRLPAHFCGVCGLKPTYGLIPQTGHVPPAPGALAERELNVVGPMARTVGDLRLLFGALTGRPAREGAASLANRRVALWSEEDSFPLSRDCGSAVDTVARKAERAGAFVAKTKPDIAGPHLLDVYLRLVVSVLAEDLPAATLGFLELMRPLAKLAVSDAPFSRAKWTVYATSRYRDWAKAAEMRAQLKLAAARFFESWDVVIAPVCATAAFPHNLRAGLHDRTMWVDGRREPYVSYLCWISLASACGLPSVVIPAGRSAEGLPVGVQLIGAAGRDDDLLDMAEALERDIGGFPPPDLSGQSRLRAGTSTLQTSRTDGGEWM